MTIRRAAPLIFLSAILFALPSDVTAFAQSFAAVASSSCDCASLSSPPSGNTSVPGGNALCAINGLSISVDLRAKRARLVNICYTIFGNALDRPHDGAVAWVDTPLGPAATYALPPQALGIFPASTTLAQCQTISMTGPRKFNAQVTVAFSTADGLAHQQWGCTSPKNPMASSWLSVEISQQR